MKHVANGRSGKKVTSHGVLFAGWHPVHKEGSGARLAQNEEVMHGLQLFDEEYRLQRFRRS